MEKLKKSRVLLRGRYPQAPLLFFSLLLFYISTQLHGNELEEALFGSESSELDAQAPTAPPSSDSPTSSSIDEDSLFGAESTETNFNDEEASLFGDEASLFGEESSSNDSFKDNLGAMLSEQLKEKENQFHIGGQYFHSFNFTGTDNQKAKETSMSSEGVADIYFDAALDDGVRFYLQQKINYEYTAPTAESTVVDFSGPEAETSIDQMWLKFDYRNKVYVTLGKQPTSWGSGFVWAPTDFINEEKESPFSLSDQRLGVSLVKVQYPFDTQGINVYGIVQTNEANTIGGARSMFRAEKILGNAELAGSISSEPHGELKGGLDFSKGLKWFDVYANASFTKHDRNNYYERVPGAGELSSDDILGLLQAGVDGNPAAVPNNAQLITLDRSDELLRQLSTGLIYIKAFDDSSQLIINSEFFYNEKGYEDEDILTILLIQNPGEFDPLYFSKRYLALGITRAAVGNSSQSYGVQYIRNLSDTSGAVVLNFGFKPYQDLNFSSNLIVFTGGSGTFNPFASDNEALEEAATRVANGELILPPDVQDNLDALPIVLEPQDTNPVTAQVGDNSFSTPRFMFLTQFSLRF